MLRPNIKIKHTGEKINYRGMYQKIQITSQHEKYKSEFNLNM